MLDLDAGKYAAFVWPAFVLTAVLLAWMVADTLIRTRRWRRRVRQLEDEAGR